MAIRIFLRMCAGKPALGTGSYVTGTNRGCSQPRGPERGPPGVFPRPIANQSNSDVRVPGYARVFSPRFRNSFLY